MKTVGAELGTAVEVTQRFREDTGASIQAMIEISDRCNEVCVHCYQEQGKKGEMDTAEICRLLDELAEQGVLFLAISGGEPTLRRDFLEIVAHAHRRGFVLRVFTNGLTMTAEMAKALYDCAVEAVEISVYSPRAEVHDFVTGVPGSFERTTRGIRHLTEAGVMVIMKAPVMSLNEDDLEAYVEMAAELGAHHQFAPGHLHPREGGERHQQAFSRSDEVFARLNRFERDEGMLSRAGGARPLREGRACGAGRSIHIEPNGEMRPCTLLEVDLGNVRGRGIGEARAQSEALASLRALDWTDLHGCRDCDLAGYCNHCYAHALAEAGDALGPYASACGAAKISYDQASGRSPAADEPVMGPFRVLAGGRCEQRPDNITARDRALADELGWTRRAGGPVPSPGVVARPGDLVQLRRPGRKRAIEQRVPSGVEGR